MQQHETWRGVGQWKAFHVSKLFRAYTSLPYCDVGQIIKGLVPIFGLKSHAIMRNVFHTCSSYTSKQGGEIAFPKYLKAHNTKDHLRTLLENLVLRVGYTWNEVAFQYTFWPQIFCPASKPFLSIRYCLFASRWVNSLTHEVVYSSLFFVIYNSSKMPRTWARGVCVWGRALNVSLAELDIVRKRNLVMSDCQGWRKHALDLRESVVFLFCICICVDSYMNSYLYL